MKGIPHEHVKYEDDEGVKQPTWGPYLSALLTHPKGRSTERRATDNAQAITVFVEILRHNQRARLVVKGVFVILEFRIRRGVVVSASLNPLLFVVLRFYIEILTILVRFPYKKAK